MKPTPSTSSTSVKRSLSPLVALLFFAFFVLLSCDDLSNDDDDHDDDGPAPQFSVEIFGSGTQGFLDGKGTAAQFNSPQGIAVASDGTVYVADTLNFRIRKITLAGLVSTLAGSGTVGAANGKGTAAQFKVPNGITVASDGTIYVADSFNHRIRKITAEGLVSTFAGSTIGFLDGQGTMAKFKTPRGIALGPGSKGNLYVADTENNRIRKITPAGEVTTIAGSTSGFLDGQGTEAQFHSPSGIAVASDGTIYVADTENNRIRKITPAGEVTTVAGSTGGFLDGPGAEAKFSNPSGIAVAADGTIYVASGSHIRKITLSSKAASTVSTIVTGFQNPFGLALSPDGSTGYVADGHQIFKLRSLSRAESDLAITLVSPQTSVAVGSKITLTATPNIPGNIRPIWSVSPSDGSIATISTEGELTGVAVGTVTVTATISGLSKEVTINVTAS